MTTLNQVDIELKDNKTRKPVIRIENRQTYMVTIPEVKPLPDEMKKLEATKKKCFGVNMCIGRSSEEIREKQAFSYLGVKEFLLI